MLPSPHPLPPITHAFRRRGLSFGAGLTVATAALLFVQLATPSAAAAAPAPVGLGTAGSYSVLGGQTVTNIGPTTLSGNLGVSPGSAITGFPPGTAGGTTHAGDAQADQAQSDVVIAYNDAAGRAPTGAVAGDLVGRTVTAGVYKSTGPLALSGTLTLDAQGDPDAVFIFQVASTLITASASHVAVINGAQACHVYWQVGSSATLGTNSTFVGSILALTSISVTTGSTVKGRALARNGSVTLDNNTFTDPACDSTPPPVDTTTTLTATPNPATTGSTVALTATVGSPGVVSTGTVSFTDHGTPLGTAPLSATGHAKLTIPAGKTARTRSITAHYNGHLLLSPSTSGSTALRIRAAAPTTSSPPASTATPTGAPSPGAPTSPLAATGAGFTALSGTTAAATLLVTGLAFLWAAAAPRRHKAQHRT